MKALILALLCLPALAGACEGSVGIRFGRAVETGTYWNNNQSYVHDLMPLIYGIRCDTGTSPSGWSSGGELNYLGVDSIDANAVSADAPMPGGYIPATGSCVGGTCAPVYRWRMKTETWAALAVLTRHFGNWSIEGGINLYEAKTSGYVTDGPAMLVRYADTTYLGVMPIVGAAYKQGSWALRAQVLWMPTPGDVPGVYTEDAQLVVKVARSFKAF